MFNKLLEICDKVATEVNSTMAGIEYSQLLSTLPEEIQKVVKDAEFKREYPKEYEKFHFSMGHNQEDSHGTKS